MSAGQLTDVRPGGMGAPTEVALRERSTMNVARARALMSADTIVQLHEPAGA
jgi:hypothetical protein